MFRSSKSGQKGLYVWSKHKKLIILASKRARIVPLLKYFDRNLRGFDLNLHFFGISKLFTLILLITGITGIPLKFPSNLLVILCFRKSNFRQLEFQMSGNPEFRVTRNSVNKTVTHCLRQKYLRRDKTCISHAEVCCQSCFYTPENAVNEPCSAM